MSNSIHKRSISGINSNISTMLKVNRQSTIKDKTPTRTSLTPTRLSNPSSSNLPSRQMATSRVEFKSSELNYDSHKTNKTPIPSERIQKNSLLKSILNMPISSIKNISDNINKKTVTARPMTATSNLLKSYREEKMKPKPLEKENSFEINNEIKVRRNSKSPKVSTNERHTISKSPLKSNRNESLLKRYEELKKRSVSPLTIGKSVIVVESKVNSAKVNNDRENKFNNNPDFREMNTSPLMIRVKEFNFRERLVRSSRMVQFLLMSLIQ